MLFRPVLALTLCYPKPNPTLNLTLQFFVKTSNFCFLVLCLALNFSNYFKVYLNSKYTIFFQNNCQNAPFGPFQQFTLGLSQVLVFSHRLQRYFADNIVFQLVCSVFKTEISSFLQKKQKRVFYPNCVFVNFGEKILQKSYISVPYFGVFRQISSRSC